MTLRMLLVIADAISSSVGVVIKSAVFSCADNSMSSPLRVTHGCILSRVKSETALGGGDYTNMSHVILTRRSGILILVFGFFANSC